MKNLVEQVVEILVICTTGVFIAGTLYSLVNNVILNHKSFSWETVEGSIERLKFQQKSVYLRYEYEINGVEYIDDNISYLKGGSLDDKYYFKKLSNVEGSIPVHFDPKNHENSVLIRRSFSVEYIMIELLFLGFLITAFLVFIRRYLLNK